MRRAQPVKFRFVIRNEDPGAKPADVRRRLDDALQDALRAALEDGLALTAKAETEGGFFGVGETAVILAILHAAKAGAGAFALGAAGAAGKGFYEGYLAPKLRKLNLLPAKLEQLPDKKSTPAKKKSASTQPAKNKATKKKPSKKKPSGR